MIETNENIVSGQILSENIKISPFEIIQLLDCSYTHELNEHAYFQFKGIISEHDKDTYLKRIEQDTKIEVSKRTEAGEEYRFFAGYLQDLQIENQNQVYYLEGKAASASILFDLERRSRSFQNPEVLYEQVISEVLSSYPNAGFIDFLSNEQMIDGPIIQFEETDWEFICRLASHFGGSVLSLDQLADPALYFGFPDPYSKGNLEAFNYRVNKNYHEQQKIQLNTNFSMPEYACAQYLTESNQMYWLGDYAAFQTRIYLIAEVKRTLDKGALINQYRLADQNGLKRAELWNNKLRGGSLKGTVAAVKEDKVLVSLDIDAPYGDKAQYWFPYSTSYTSEHNIGWYMMPEIGDRIRVYFPTGKEKEAYALASIREDQGNSENLIPSVKTLKNKFGKTITLEPDKITICGNGTEIILSDHQGVIVKSDKGIQINAKTDLQVSGKDILMDAADQITLSVKGNSITVADDIVLNGTEVKLN